MCHVFKCSGMVSGDIIYTEKGNHRAFQPDTGNCIVG